MGIFKSKDGGPSKFAGVLKGVLSNPTIRTLVPFGNVLGAVSGVMVRNRTSDSLPADLDAVREISNPIIKDIYQLMVQAGIIIGGILSIVELLKD